MGRTDMKVADLLRSWSDAAIESFFVAVERVVEENRQLFEENDLLRHQLRWAEHCAAAWRGRCLGVANLMSVDRGNRSFAIIHNGVWRMQFHGIHHVAIITADYARSKHFYVEVLGLKVLAEHYRDARDSWKLDLALVDGTQVELFSFPNPPPRPSRPEACGLRHLALRVNDIDAAIAHLHAHGVATEALRIDEYTGKRFTFFADPDGLPLELYEE